MVPESDRVGPVSSATRILILLLAATLLACARRSDVGVTDGAAMRIKFLLRVSADDSVRDEFVNSVKANAGVPDTAVLRRMSDADTANTAWLARVVARDGWPTVARVGADGASAALLLVQHADRDTAFQARMMPMLERAFAAREISGEEMALFTDRVAAGRGQAQLYGTQAEMRNGRAVLKPISDSSALDARRARMGLPPVREYLRLLDSIYGGRSAAP